MLADEPLSAALLPPPDAWLGFAGFVLAVLLCLPAGAVAGRRMLPELRLLAGWGVLCLALTVWGVASAAPLRWPLYGLAALGVVALPFARHGLGSAAGLALLTLPLWLVLLPVRASQIDTWLNLLPNAAYLADFGMFPGLGRPESYSFLPGAPYNTQFIAYATAVFSGQFAQAAMSWFNVLLVCAASLLLARAVAAGTDSEAPAWRAPPWWALACGFLLAAPLNPGFTPRVSFAPYGETPLAVTLLAAVWLGAQGVAQRRAGRSAAGSLIALALVLVAMVNTKQSGPGLLVALGAPLVLLGLTVPGRRLATAGWLVAAQVPALTLYGVWRWYTAHAGAAELTTLPRAQWNTGIVPQILAAMAHDALLKATLFVLLLAAVAAGVAALARRDASVRGSVMMLTAACIVLYNGYVLLTYIVHFPPEMALLAHSYARYNSHLSLAAALSVVLLARPCAARFIARRPERRQRQAARLAVALVPVLPLALFGVLRFDLDPPQPALRTIALGTKPYIEDGERLGLILAGDRDDAAASFLRGSLMFTPPRRRMLDFHFSDGTAPADYEAMAASGYKLILATCTPAGLPGVPPGEAALLRWTDRGWYIVERWVYPPELKQRHFSAMIGRAPLCAAP